MADLQMSRRNAGAEEKKKVKADAAKTSGNQKEKAQEKDSCQTAEDPVPVEKQKTAPEPGTDSVKKETGNKSLEGQFSLFDMIEEGF